MPTIRLERAMLGEGETLEWNILDEAREKNLCQAWGVGINPEDLQETGAGGAPVAGVSAGAGGAAGGEDGMDVDGQAPGSSAGPSSRPMFDMDDDAEEIARRLEEKYGDAPKKKGRAPKRKKVEEYNQEDPFIDDSEANPEMLTHFGRAKKEGFFVHLGALELVEEEPQTKLAKPRVQKKGATRAVGGDAAKPPRPSLSEMLVAKRKAAAVSCGSALEPIAIDDSDGDDAGPSQTLSSPPLSQEVKDVKDGIDLTAPQPPVDRMVFRNAPKDPRFLPPYDQFPKEVQTRLLILRAHGMKHKWDPNSKGKFPDHLKVYLQHAGEAAFQAGLFGLSDREDVDHSFISSLPSALPYNEFTLRKLVTKLCYQSYLSWLQECEAVGLTELQELVDESKGEAIDRYEAALSEWREEVKAWDAKHPNGVNLNPPDTDPSSSAPDAAQSSASGTNPNAPGTSTAPAKNEDQRPVEPPRRFTWTPDMREVFVQLLDNMHDMADLVKKGQEWNIHDAVSGKEWGDIAIKSRLYKKINDLFPAGYMTTNLISREMTRTKAKKKDAAAKQA